MADWKVDMQQAKAIGIDGFALNCAPPRVDSYTPKQLANAYQAAQELNFKVFISFDFAYWGDADTATIASIVGNYSTHPAQAYYNGGALVSTFIGDYFNWNAVKSAVGGKKLTIIPMLQDPFFITYSQTGIDGAFSWYAWATGGGNSVIPGPMTTVYDDRFVQHCATANKPYMARKSIFSFGNCMGRSSSNGHSNCSRLAVVLYPFQLKVVDLHRRRAARSAMGTDSCDETSAGRDCQLER